MTQNTRPFRTGNQNKFLASTLLALSLGLTSAQSANANGAFRDFKNNNPGLENREVRRIYREQFSVGTAVEHADPFHPIASTQAQIKPLPIPNLQPDRERTDAAVHRQTMQLQENGLLANARLGVDLNLDSNAKNVTLGAKLFARTPSVTINRNGEEVVLMPGSQVTAAEYVAVKQMVMTGSQTVALDSSGRAVGGTVDLSQITGKNDRMRADDLTVPVNVTAYGVFAGNSSFQVLGDLVNAGSIYAETNRRGGARVIIQADSLTNEATGLITSVARTGEGIVDLTLEATRSITNLGTISSSGTLELQAGAEVKNASGATITAPGNVTVTAPSIVNTSSITSSTGNVTLGAPNELLVDNRLGTVAAPEGSVNIRTAAFKDSANTIVYGGDLLSQSVNVNTGRGTADITVRELTGRLNQKGFASHVSTATDVLSLGEICLSGDPTYKNATGDIVIAGSITVGEALTLISSGDITNSVSATLTAGNNTSGFDITLIAGANIISGGSDTTVIGPIPPTLPGATATTISGTASASGGNVLLGQSEFLPVTINARATSGNNNNGGNVLIAAFNNGANKGVIDMSFSQINTGGRGSGNNGNVTLIAGGSPVGATIRAGAINTTGGGGTGGDVTISSFTPTSSAGNVTFDQFGVRTSVSQIVASSTSQFSPHIFLAGDIITAGNVNITSGSDGNITIGDFNITCRGQNSIVNLTANGLGNIVGSGFTTISCDTLNLLVATGDIGNTSDDTPIFTDATTITANGDTSSTDVLLQTFNPGLNTFSGSAFSMNVATQGPIIANPDFGPIVAETLLIGSFGGSAGLNAQHPLEVDATFLFVAGLGGDVYVHNNNTGQTNLTGGQALQAARTFQVTSDGTIGLAVDDSIRAQNVILQPASGFVNLAGTITGTQSVSLVSNMTINPANISATVNTPLLNLTSVNGDVGISPAARFQASTGVGAVAAYAPNGSVYLQGAASSKAGIAGGFANGVFDYAGTSSTTISGNIETATGEIKVTINGAGTLAVNPNAVLNSAQNLTLLITDLVNGSTKQKITLGKNAALQTQSGDILLSVGALAAPVSGTPPTKGIGYTAANGGQIFWGDFGATGKGVNSVIANGNDIIFSNTIKSSAITLSGGVAIVTGP